MAARRRQRRTNPDQPALFDLVSSEHDGDTPAVWSWGMGQESTTGVVEWLENPEKRPRELRDDLSNLVVMVAQTGDEWSWTIELCEQFMLPLLRKHRVRLVEVARSGPTKKYPITVFQDTREPWRLHGDGDYKLSDEHRTNGVGPILTSRSCSNKAKGVPMDLWRRREFGNRPYIHAIGFNAREGKRIERDPQFGEPGQRTPIFPLFEWGFDREACGEYLLDRFGVVWPKSACRMCPFAGSAGGWPETLGKYLEYPREAFQHITDEYCAVAFNERADLFGKAGSLTDRLARDGATQALELGRRQMDAMTWGLYRVQRVYSAKARAYRKLTLLGTGPRSAAESALEELARAVRIVPNRAGRAPRVWLAERAKDVYPSAEEFFVAAPAQAVGKMRPGFPKAWAACTGAGGLIKTDSELASPSGEAKVEAGIRRALRALAA
jgi:hypothetical protein